jgi:NAD(P)-dependent dehydrogenase (short-subunit alcohol dehydrogenase family)
MTRNGEARTARHDQIEWKDRCDHRRRHWLGLAAAKQFIEEGAFVFIFGRRQDALDAAVAELGPNARAVKDSVSDAFLASSDSSFMTASEVAVDGGLAQL